MKRQLPPETSESLAQVDQHQPGGCRARLDLAL